MSAKGDDDDGAATVTVWEKYMNAYIRGVQNTIGKLQLSAASASAASPFASADAKALIEREAVANDAAMRAVKAQVFAVYDADGDAHLSFAELKNVCLDLLACRAAHIDRELALTGQALVLLLRCQLAEAGAFVTATAASDDAKAAASAAAAFERDARAAVVGQHALLLKTATVLFAVFQKDIDRFALAFANGLMAGAAVTSGGAPPPALTSAATVRIALNTFVEGWRHADQTVIRLKAVSDKLLTVITSVVTPQQAAVMAAAAGDVPTDAAPAPASAAAVADAKKATSKSANGSTASTATAAPASGAVEGLAASISAMSIAGGATAAAAPKQ